MRRILWFGSLSLAPLFNVSMFFNGRCVFVWMLVLGFSLLAPPAGAHLLNMTEVQLRILEGNEIRLDAKIDLAKHYSDRAAYFSASRQQPCALLHADNEIIDGLLGNVRVDNTSLDTSETTQAITLQNALEWQLASCEFDPSPEATYLDIFQWPKVELSATTNFFSGQRLENLRVSFEPGFRFEEPIAVSVINEADQRSMTRWLIAGQKSPTFSIDGPVSTQGLQWRSYAHFVIQGFRHILPLGLDHILFILGLTLLAQSAKKLIFLLSVFTFSHSITLILTTLGWFSPDGRIVEVFIALSIAWVGIEVLLSKWKFSLSYLVIFIFGLIHGMGFAGALRKLNLPDNGALLALVGFNIGVEIGQLFCVAIIVALGFLMRRVGVNILYVKNSVSLLIVICGCVWAINRVIQ